MKTLKLLTLIFVFTLTGCNDDDNNYVPIYNPPTTEEVDGAWELSNVSGGFAGTDHDFAPGEVTWVFDEDTHTVEVFNNNTDNDKVDFFDSGTYNYAVVINQVTPESCGFNFAIDNLNLGCFAVTQEQFTISMVEADGHLITLKRPQIIPFN